MGWAQVRAWLGRLGLVFASCAVTLGLFEVALYLVPAWNRATTRDERFAFSPYLPSRWPTGLHARPGVQVRHVDRDFCFDSARTISDADMTQFTFAHDSHWNGAGHWRIDEALATWLEREPVIRRVRTSRPP